MKRDEEPRLDPGPAPTAPLIELSNVTKTYRNGEFAVRVLHGISLKIYPGEFIAIMGASGSGKTTLMNILGCLDRCSTGSYRFMGEDVSDLDRDELARLRREAFGFVFQSYNLIATATAVENVEVPAVYSGMDPIERETRAEQLLETLGLGERLDHKPNQLSGGQQQRVSIARALMNGGRIILADEPTGALDSKSGEEVMNLLRELSRRGHTIILITHAAEVAREARRVIEIRDGDIVSDPGPQPAEEGTKALGASRDRDVPLIAGFHEAAKTALRALRSNLFRTVLTLLGIVIGVGSVITMLAVGDGARKSVMDRISSLGSNLLLVRPGGANRGGKGGSIATLVADDAEAIARLPNILAAVPEMGGGATVRFGNIDYQTTATATSETFPIGRNWEVDSGTFFSANDVRQYSSVVVIGRTVADTLFPRGGDPIGKYIMVENILCQVIGVMSTKGATPFGADQDDVVFVPLTTGSLRLFGRRFLRTITVAVEDTSVIDDTQEAVNTLLLERHRTNDFFIRNMASIIETASETQNTLTLLLGAVAAISLLVGGIGVMNIMLVSVTERTREIGIRMATGARTRNIMQQFLTEAIVVSSLGGFIGVIGGLGTAAIIQYFGKPIVYSWGPVLLAFGCAFATGLIFGFMPARKAAHLDPVVALSAE